MSDIAIRVENLSKRYRIGMKEEIHDTFAGALTSFARSPLKNLKGLRRLSHFEEDGNDPEDVIWALKNVSFEVKRGEVLGIIGRNGAGKSTLLKILSKITYPTTGRVELHGRVSSLLEVGTGFHPELTGRENIYLNGTILGMTRKEIDRKFDEIVDFSGVEKFIDTPVKRYSSGMRVRLAFSVAAHLEPEILLVDEVLAVGDVEFQKKCLGKMGEVARGGRTVLFVSHNMGAVNSLTQKCIYLHIGQIIANNDTRSVIDQYLMESIEHQDQSSGSLEFYRRGPLAIDPPVEITGISVEDSKKEPFDIGLGNPFTIFVQLNVNREIRREILKLKIKNIQGVQSALLFSLDQGFSLSLMPGKHTVSIRVENNPFAPGQYFANIGVSRTIQSRAHDVIVDYPIFRVVNNGQITLWPDRPWGIVHINSLQWQLFNEPLSKRE